MNRHQIQTRLRALFGRPWLKQLLQSLVLGLTLLPLLISPDPPLYDYPAHLLEAAVAQRPVGEPSAYLPRPGWMTDSNALATFAMVGAAQFLPLPLAGRLVLGLTLVLFFLGFGALLHSTGKPLLLLVPLLAHNSTFSSGWVNFSLGLALGLLAISTFRRWSADGHAARLIWLSLVLGLIYSAHLVVWTLVLLVLFIEHAARGDANASRAGFRQLLLGSCVPLPLLLANTPAFIGVLVAGAVAWVITAALRRLRLRASVVAAAALACSAGGLALGLALERWLQRYDPELDYSPFARLSFIARTFTIAHQTETPADWLTFANLGVVVLLASLGGLLLWASLRTAVRPSLVQLAPLGALAVLYGALPSKTGSIAIVEPRIIVLSFILFLSAVRLPKAGAIRRIVLGLSLAAGLLGGVAATGSARAYQAQAGQWRAAFVEIDAGPTVLVLRSQVPTKRDLRHLIETFYDGSYFSATLALDGARSTSRVFGNGPFYLQPDLERVIFLWAQRPIPTPACRETRAHYTSVLGWNTLEPAVIAALEECYGPGTPLPPFIIWR